VGPIIDDAACADRRQTEDGYFWWLKSFEAGGRAYPAWYISGNGGNNVVVVPSLRLSVVIRSTNYGTRNA